MTRYLGYCALALLTVLPTASVYSAVQNDTFGLYAPDPSDTPDIQNSAPVTPPPGDDSLYSDDVPDSSNAPENTITPLNSIDVMSFSIGPVSLRMTASEAISAITDKLGQSSGDEIQKRCKRAARTVLTGMCYSVGSATRQGSSSLTRFIGQSAITSSTWRR